MTNALKCRTFTHKETNTLQILYFHVLSGIHSPLQYVSPNTNWLQGLYICPNCEMTPKMYLYTVYQ